MRQGKEGSGRGRGGGEREGRRQDGRGGEEMDAGCPALFKLLNTPLALLQGPSLRLDSLLMLHARHERRAMGKSKDDHPV